MRRVMKCSVALVLSLVPPAAAMAQPQWQLVEDLRIGGEDEMTIFTDIRSIVAGPQGHIFVLDARAQEIRVFDRSGKFATLAARKGQGPGEIANANGLLLVNETVWVNDPSNGRRSVYSAVDGKYLRQITIPIRSYGYLWDAGIDGEGRFIDPIFVTTDRVDPATRRPVSEPRLRRVRNDGTIVDTVAAAACVQRSKPAKVAFTGSAPGVMARSFYGIPFLPRELAVFDGRGGYWCTPNDEYLLAHRSLANGDTLHAVRKPYTRVPVTRAQREKAITDARTWLARLENIDADYSLIPAAHPVFQRLDVDDKGQLWARRVTAGNVPDIDVYDASGRQIATVTTTVPFQAFLPIHIRGDFVYGVIRDEDDVPYVVRARIVRGER